MLTIKFPADFRAELTWVVDVIFREFLGLDYYLSAYPGRQYIIEYGGNSLALPDVFFSGISGKWLDPSTIPTSIMGRWKIDSANICPIIVDQELPIIFGGGGFEKDGRGNASLAVDIFGSVFFMLSNYEEYLLVERDEHDRIPSSATLASRAGYLERPLADEYVELLWAAMCHLWPRLTRKADSRKILISCDVDVPYAPHVTGALATAKKASGDVVKRKNPVEALQSCANYAFSSFGSYAFDPHNTFDWIMDVNEKAGNKVLFTFLAGTTNRQMDGAYSLRETRIRRLLRHIHDRGHEIGLHASYETYRSSDELSKEFVHLRSSLESEGVVQDAMGNRQHYLRWCPRSTASALEFAGIAYDSTLGFAERPGFRCGTGREYTMYDVLERRPRHLRQRPLIVMDDSIADAAYLGLGYTQEALSYILDLKIRTKRLGTDFSLLWHNSNLRTAAARSIYQQVITD